MNFPLAILSSHYTPPLVRAQFNFSDNSAFPTATIVSLPYDLLLEIVSFLEYSSDILHFGASCSGLFSIVASALYKSVTLNSSDQCINTLRMLSRHPEISCHIQKLIVRPDPIDQTQLTRHARGDELIICSTIMHLAVRLDVLHTFVWDANEVPPDDSIWFIMQKSCTRLRTIGSSIGSDIPPHSNLFEFGNLLGFSLVFKADFYDNNAEDAFFEPTFSRLWDMLIDRCPDLEELSIYGFSLYPTDARRLVQGRWPKLRKLTLGDVDLNDSQISTLDFFNAHKQLQILHTSRHVLSPTHLTSALVIDHGSSFMLPHLTEFGGTLEQVQALIALGYTSLTTVRFPQPMLMHDDHITLQAVSMALRSISCLTTLSISFKLHSTPSFDNGGMLKAIVSSCPRLVHLELGCLRYPSFSVVSLNFIMDSNHAERIFCKQELFSNAIKNLRKLRTFKLTLVRFSFDELLHKCAAQLALANPRLHRFTITFNSNATYWPIPHSISSYPSSYVESGTYTITTDEYGLPIALFAVERKTPQSFPAIIWTRSSTVTRRYQVNLQPRRPKKNLVGLMGLGQLVVERSAAGDELRMLLVFVVLLWLAVWGFFAVGLR